MKEHGFFVFTLTPPRRSFMLVLVPSNQILIRRAITYCQSLIERTIAEGFVYVSTFWARATQAICPHTQWQCLNHFGYSDVDHIL